MAEKVEEARKFRDYVAEQMKGIGFRVVYTTVEHGKVVSDQPSPSVWLPMGNEIDQRNRRVLGKDVWDSCTVLSKPAMQAMLRLQQSRAFGEGGWHDNTKKSKLTYAKDYAGKIEGRNRTDIFNADTLTIFPWALYEEMNEIIRKLAIAVLDGDVKMHMPEYQIVVNAYTLAFYEGAGIREDGAFDEWMKLPDRVKDRWTTDKASTVSTKHKHDYDEFGDPKTEHERRNTISKFRWRRRFNGPPGDAPVQRRSSRNLGDHPSRT